MLLAYLAGLTAAALPAALAITLSPRQSAPVAARMPPLTAVAPQFRLRVGPAYPAAHLEDLTALLAGAGFAPVLIERAPFTVTSSRVGYFRAEDRAAAEKLAALVSAKNKDAAQQIVVRDYSELVPGAAPGRLDLWIKG